MSIPGLSSYITWAHGGNPVDTHLHGQLNTSYDSLVRLFGSPNAKGDKHKVDAEWVLTFTLFEQFHKVATIYNYKDGKNYLGAEGLPVEEIRDWHIGARTGDGEVVGFIASMLLNAEPVQ
jgi:hypothetical protein